MSYAVYTQNLLCMVLQLLATYQLEQHQKCEADYLTCISPAMSGQVMSCLMAVTLVDTGVQML